ncbi:hypothetical protein glysoja_047856 [Glycine soja]|uniref:Uncharacterized protein n=1 Tax=Glycine soja TaxID=3848 RepID=A0A0B2Q435_GLYSO|nr:hypothetical protein glysoja_047856 [Glycine soja]
MVSKTNKVEITAHPKEWEELVDLVLLIVALCHLLPSVISGQLVLFFSSGPLLSPMPPLYSSPFSKSNLVVSCYCLCQSRHTDR